MDVHKLLRDSSTKDFLNSLSDQSDKYPYKVVAATLIFEARKKHSKEVFVQKVNFVNKGKISPSQLLLPSERPK